MGSGARLTCEEAKATWSMVCVWRGQEMRGGNGGEGGKRGREGKREMGGGSCTGDELPPMGQDGVPEDSLWVCGRRASL